jgi:3-oxoadipate enol-lactonase
VAVLDAAGVERAQVLGVSMAGLIMVELASTRPERVASLVFVSAMSPDPDAGMGEDFFVGLDGEAFDNMIRAMGEVSEDDRAWVAAELEAAARRAPARPDAASRHQEAAFRLGWPSLDDVRRITAPAVVVHGRLDRLLPVAHAEALAAGIDGASLLVRDTMGHLPRPADWGVIADEVVQLVQRAG